MDVELEFPTSPSKRQRTLSPEETRDASAAAQPIEAQSDARPEDHTPTDNGIARSEANGDAEKASSNDSVGQSQDRPSANPPDHDSNSLLDALMLQVEAASAPPPVSLPEPTSADAGPAAGVTNAIPNGAEDTKGVGAHADQMQNAQQQQPMEQPRTTTDTTDQMDVTTDGGVNGDGQATQGDAHNGTENTITLDTNTTIPTVGNDTETPAVATATASAAMVDAIPPTETETLAPEPGAEGAEWEIDSSPYESSSDSDDTTSSEEDSDEDEDDDDGDYAMLDPEEAARILMQGDGGSDDEGGGRNRGDKADGAPLRTAHERPEEVIPKPDIVVTEDMKIEELGNVEVVVENTVVIKAKTSGEYQVLETGSLICLPDRSVVGVVADLIGRVEEPRYTIRFTNDEDIKQAGLAEVGTTVFYVPQHSTFVFTQPLKAVKGSDASNFHDEEVAEDEMEFSDDEAEAEHKRQMKARRQGRSTETGRGRGGGSSRHPRGSHRGGAGGGRGGANQSYGSTEMNYDDVVDGSGGVGDEGYTPLQRPANMAEMMMTSPQLGAGPGPGPSHSLPPKPSRGDFSRGRGGRGRGGGRGGSSRGGHHHQQQHGNSGGFGQQAQAAAGSWNQQPGNNNFQSGFTPQQMQQIMSLQMPNFNLPAVPALPQGMQGMQSNNTPGSFNFNASGFNNGASPNFPFMQQPQPQQQGFPASFGLNFQQQQQQTYQQRWGGQQQGQNMAAPAAPSASSSGNFTSGPWASNPALAAALQRQAQQEQERRNQG
ncbi:hypothetical protein ABEF95_005022 [Exophiala dermatitidis]